MAPFDGRSPRQRPPTVAVSVLRALLARAAAAGQSPESWLARFAVDPVCLEDVDARVPAAIVRALWEELPAICGDEALGLNLAARSDGALGIVAYLIMHATTLGQGLDTATRHASLLQDVAVCTVEPMAGEGGGSLFVQTPRPGGVAPPRHAVEFTFARLVHMARRSTAREDLRPTVARFAFPRPADTSPHERLFQAPLVFEHPRNELGFDAATLALPQRAADPWLRETVARRARELAAELGAVSALRREVLVALMDALQAGDVDLSSVAAALSLSERTLQRRLAAEGLRFRALVDEARHQLACHYLAEGNVGLAEIALLLGFSEQAAFQRAFVRWTGVTPGQFRRSRRSVAPSV